MNSEMGFKFKSTSKHRTHTSIYPTIQSDDDEEKKKEKHVSKISSDTSSSSFFAIFSL